LWEKKGPGTGYWTEENFSPRHADGDDSAFPELVALYRAPVYGYLVRCGVPAGARDDLFQEIFIRVHNSAGKYKPSRPLNPWIFTIVSNSTRSFFRKKKVRQIIHNDENVPERADGVDLQALSEAQETAIWLEKEIQKLPLPQREVLVLCCIECLEQKEIAKALEMPLSTVKTNLRRARLTLGKALLRRKAQLSREVE